MKEKVPEQDTRDQSQETHERVIWTKFEPNK